MRKCSTLQHGWRFALQPIPYGCPVEVHPRCSEADAALRMPDENSDCSVAACAVRYNDSGWVLRSVPHDFTTESAPNVDDAADSVRAWFWFNHHLNRSKVLSQSSARRSAEMIGSLPLGQAWYRRTLSLSAAPASHDAWLEFDGVMANAIVFLDGILLGQHRGGYLPFTLPIPHHARRGSAQLAVFVDGSRPPPAASWWADGAGIVRHVRLCSASRLRVSTSPAAGSSGVTLRTQVLDSNDRLRHRQEHAGSSLELTAAALITTETTVVHTAPAPTGAATSRAWFRVRTRLIYLGSSAMREVTREHGRTTLGGMTGNAASGGEAGGEGWLENVTASSLIHSLAPGESMVVGQTLHIDRARLWSVESPALYEYVTTVVMAADTYGGRRGERHGNAHRETHGGVQAGEEMVIDEVSSRVGVRRIEWSRKAGGLLLNGRRLVLRGVANHDDFAGVGTALPDALQYFRVQRMKGIGANAWRTAHNPPTPALLDACDALGMVVILENPRLGDGEAELTALRALVLRDRHHPSVIAYSLCNEGLCRAAGDSKGELGERSAEAVRTMQQLVRSLDSDEGRLSTLAINRGFGGPLEQAMHGLVGYNYHHLE